MPPSPDRPERRPRRSSRLALAALLVPLACSLVEGCESPSSETNEGSATTSLCALPARVRRLTRAELDAVASSLVGPTRLFTESLAAEDRPLGFDNHDGLVATGLVVDQLAVVSAKLAERVVGDPRWSSCDSDEDDCFDTFVDDFVARAWRRPVTAEERAALKKVFDVGREGEGWTSGLRLVADAVFQSSGFLYRTELGPPDREGPGPLEGHEIASALSFLVTGGPPDEALVRAGAEGALLDPDERERHARRLLATDAGRARLVDFVLQWLGLSQLESVQKDNLVYPDFSNDWRTSMRAETHAFVEHLFREGDGKVSTLLGADYTFVDDRMAEFYGLSARPGAKPARVALPAERRGVLTQASVLATYAHFGETSPVLRGKMVFSTLLCGILPPPPASVSTALPVPDGKRTIRERLAAHTSNDSCAGCHRNMDPIGLGFENFDGLGKARDTELGAPVDASGVLRTPLDGEGVPFVGGAEVAAMLATHPEVEACARAQLFRYGFGRKESEGLCEADDVRDALQRSGGDLREALVVFVRSAGFVERKEQTP